MYLEQLGIYGWNQRDEHLLLASLLTGDPLLLIGNHGCAKTHLGNKIAQALDKKYLVYDASKAMFEDVLGYPNTAKLQEGVMEYVPSPITVWDKEFILIDELSRAEPSMQSKWLDLIRSRTLMGFPTQVKWVWAAMNPSSYSGANLLDEALVGRFATFLYPPDVLKMNEADRVRVLTHINGDDAPSLTQWTDLGETAGTVPREAVEATGRSMSTLLRQAAHRFLQLRSQLETLPQFLARFAALLAQESQGKLALDGRRLGFLYRNLLANRAIELAAAESHNTHLIPFRESARHTVLASIPIGLGEDGLDFDEAAHKIEVCFDLLSEYFEEGANLAIVDQIYELLTTRDLLRKAELLLAYDLGEFAQAKAWNDLMNEDRDLTVLAYTALAVETRRPGSVPSELLESLSARIEPQRLGTGCIPKLEDDAVEYIDAIETLLDQQGDLRQLIAYNRVAELVESKTINPQTIEHTRNHIERDVEAFERLVAGQKGAVA